MPDNKDKKQSFIDKHAEGIATTIVFAVSFGVPILGTVAYIKWLNGMEVGTVTTIIEDGIAITTRVAKNGKIMSVIKTPMELIEKTS